MWGSAPIWVQVAILVVVPLLVLAAIAHVAIPLMKHDNEERPADEEDAL
jgi:hypothetical protein